MTAWTKNHRTLLTALRAERVVPELIARLSLERLDARSDDARKLRDWVASLEADPGWQLIAPQLDGPPAWPAVWHRAVEAGFSPRTDHHHALLFERFCEELVAELDYEVAQFAWKECVAAWLRVFDSDYVDELFEALSAGDSSVQKQLLYRLADRRDAGLRGALRLEEHTEAGFDRRRTRFEWRALAFLDDRLEEADAPHPTLSALQNRVEMVQRRVMSDVLGRFQREVDALALADADFEAISRPFEWMRQVFTILPIEASVAARVVDATVDIGWKVRKLDFPGADSLIAHLLGLTAPFNERLETYVDNGEAFGHNAACADFLVFQGEQRDATDQRVAFFERALEACPGHRNARMMLSYEKLREASDVLVRMRLTPAALRLVPGASERVGSALEAVASLIDDAEELYPSNEQIEDYRQKVLAESERLGAPIHE